MERPRFSEIVSELEKVRKEKPDEKEFITIFKAELNTKQGVEYQFDLFELDEAFKIYFYNGNVSEAEAKVDQIFTLLKEKKIEYYRKEFLKADIYKGDILMCKKEYEMAEKQYLECLNSEGLHKTHEKHLKARLLTLYQLIMIEKDSKHQPTDEEFNKIMTILVEFETHVFVANSTDEALCGFLQIHQKLLKEINKGRHQSKLFKVKITDELNNEEEYRAKMTKLLKNQEVIDDFIKFFKAVQNLVFMNRNQYDLQTNFGKVGSLLLFELEDEGVFFPGLGRINFKKPQMKLGRQPPPPNNFFSPPNAFNNNLNRPLPFNNSNNFGRNPGMQMNNNFNKPPIENSQMIYKYI